MNKNKDNEIICDKKANYNDCELAILRSAVDEAEAKMKKKTINTPEIQSMIHIVEDFLRYKKLICYGGQSINEELPEKDKFYNKPMRYYLNKSMPSNKKWQRLNSADNSVMSLF